jgi:predicted benzoate:H+ symporter BenE
MQKMFSKMSYNNLDRLICGVLALGLFVVTAICATAIYFLFGKEPWVVVVFLAGISLSADFRMLRRSPLAENFSQTPGSVETNPDMKRKW